MYHIPTDKRAERSAGKIYKALLVCLDSKSFTDVTVADIYRESGVSRATFYRLFDNTIDVLLWKCDCMFEGAVACFDPEHPDSFETVVLTFIESVMDERRLVPVMTSSIGTYVISDVHARHRDEVRSVFLSDMQLTPLQEEQMSELLSALIPVTLRTWQHYPEERAEAILHRVKESVGLLFAVFGPRG